MIKIKLKYTNNIYSIDGVIKGISKDLKDELKTFGYELSKKYPLKTIKAYYMSNRINGIQKEVEEEVRFLARLMEENKINIIDLTI